MIPQARPKLRASDEGIFLGTCTRTLKLPLHEDVNVARKEWELITSHHLPWSKPMDPYSTTTTTTTTVVNIN